jgi:hypothetical protein
MRRPLSSSLLFVFGAVLSMGCPEAPPDGVAPCPAAQILDGEECVSAACGTAPWGDVGPDPDGTTWYVLAGSESDGDGSEERPFPRIGAAMEAATAVPGGRVVIGAGLYPERLAFSRAHDGLELHGRCPELVTLDGEGFAAASLSVFASAVVVRSMTITGGRPGIIAGQVPGAPGLVLRGNDLVVETNGGYGVLATGSGVLVDLAESVIRDVRPTNDLSPGRGLGVEQGATLLAVGLRVEQIQGIGVQVAGVASSGEIDGLTVLDTIAHDDGTLGRGLHVVDGGSLDVRNTEIGVPVEHAIVVEGGSSSLDLSDGTVACGSLWCTRAQGGGSLAAARVDWSLSDGPGLQVHGAFSFADLSDVSLIGPSSSSLTVESGAALLVDGARIEEGAGTGVHAAGFGTLASLTDVDVTRPGLGGVLITDGAEADADDVSVTDAGGPGLLVARDGALECTACQVDGAVFAGALAMAAGRLQLAGGSMRATTASVLQGGGVGVLGLDDGSAATVVHVDDTIITGHPYAGLAFAGGGTWRVAQAIVEASGGGGVGPGLLALDGTSYWQEPSGPGLFVFGNTFRQLPNDALLFDAATGTLAGNGFEQIGQLQLYTQNCGGVAPPQSAEQLVTNDCTGPARDLGLGLAWPDPPVAPGL